MMRRLLFAAAVVLAACQEPEVPLPTSDARIEVHPRIPFGQIRQSVYDLTSSRYPGVRIELRAPEFKATVAAELYGQRFAEPLDRLVVVRVASEEILIDDIAATDAASLAGGALARASGRADLAVLRVDNDVELVKVAETIEALRANGFERVVLSAIRPTRATPPPRGDWLETLERCPFPESLDGKMATMEVHANGQGGIGSVKILAQDEKGAGYEGAMCVSTQTFPPHAGSDLYRLRFRFSR